MRDLLKVVLNPNIPARFSTASHSHRQIHESSIYCYLPLFSKWEQIGTNGEEWAAFAQAIVLEEAGGGEGTLGARAYSLRRNSRKGVGEDKV